MTVNLPIIGGETGLVAEIKRLTPKAAKTFISAITDQVERLGAESFRNREIQLRAIPDDDEAVVSEDEVKLFIERAKKIEVGVETPLGQLEVMLAYAFTHNFLEGNMDGLYNLPVNIANRIGDGSYLPNFSDFTSAFVAYEAKTINVLWRTLVLRAIDRAQVNIESNSRSYVSDRTTRRDPKVVFKSIMYNVVQYGTYARHWENAF